MPQDYNDHLRHESVRGSDGANLLDIFKLMVGTLLIVVGAGLGIYLAESVFQVVFGDEPPAMIERVAELAVEKVKAEAPNANAQQIELAPDLMQTILYGLTFFLLLLPMIVATTLISSGVKLMRGQANEVIAMLAEKLTKSDR